MTEKLWVTGYNPTYSWYGPTLEVWSKVYRHKIFYDPFPMLDGWIMRWQFVRLTVWVFVKLRMLPAKYQEDDVIMMLVWCRVIGLVGTGIIQRTRWATAREPAWFVEVGDSFASIRYQHAGFFWNAWKQLGRWERTKVSMRYPLTHWDLSKDLYSFDSMIVPNNPGGK